MESDEVGKRIREYRRRRNLSQIKLAEKLNISFQQVQKYEKGKTDIPLSRLVSIAKALDVQVNDFFKKEKSVDGGAVDVFENPPAFLAREESELLHCYRKIENKKIRESVLNFLKSLSDSF